MELPAQAIENLLASNPEFTFRETCAELVKAGDLDYEGSQDPYVHAALHRCYAAAKARANFGRVNTDI